MKRTTNLRLAVMLGALSLCFPAPSAKAADAGVTNQGRMVIDIKVAAPPESDDVRLWLPYPESDSHQTISQVTVEGDYSRHAITRLANGEGSLLYAEWKKSSPSRHLTLSFDVTAKERNHHSRSAAKAGAFPPGVTSYLKSSRLIPTDGEVAWIANEVTKGISGVDKKARAIYDWVVENTFRDPTIKGCGLGIVEVTLAKRGGKCADISSVFVALARAAGVPSREVFGLRLGKKMGENDMSSGHHCWAEYYQPGYGWVPVDPADVRKAMLVKKLDLVGAKEYREFYFGAVGANRIALGKGGRSVTLDPPQSAGPLNYFMYPYAEVEGKELPWLDQVNQVAFAITYTRDAP